MMLMLLPTTSWQVLQFLSESAAYRDHQFYFFICFTGIVVSKYVPRFFFSQVIDSFLPLLKLLKVFVFFWFHRFFNRKLSEDTLEILLHSS